MKNVKFNFLISALAMASLITYHVLRAILMTTDR